MKKITEILKNSKERKIFLHVFVNKETNELINADKALVVDLTKCEKFEFELSQPTFEVISASLSAMITSEGKIDMLAAGRVVFDSCYTQNQGLLEDIQASTALYAGLCTKCADIADVAHAEFKKK